MIIDRFCLGQGAYPADVQVSSPVRPEPFLSVCVQPVVEEVMPNPPPDQPEWVSPDPVLTLLSSLGFTSDNRVHVL